MDVCGVCCEIFNKTNHKKVTCPFCDLSACKTCCQTYLLSSIEDPHCFKCKNLWNREFVDSFCTRHFRNNLYKTHRENVLFDREKVRMPETQPEVERIIQMRQLNKRIDEQRVRLIRLHHTYTLQGVTMEQRRGFVDLIQLNSEMTQSFEELSRLRRRTHVVASQSTLTRKCPKENCKGFIDENWYCGLCQNTFCSKCNELKEEDHVCNPDSVKTMKLLKRDTKPCPKCGTMIYKIDGCGQMWCTDCHTAFSWTTGRIETGRIHNPHYIEFKNKHFTSREHGDIPCGGVPDFYELQHNPFMFRIRRIISDLVHDLNYRYDDIYDNENLWLRVNYMLNDIPEFNFKRELQRRDKLREKNRDIRNIHQMFIDTAGDLLRQYILDKTKYTELKNLVVKLVEYINDETKKIHRRYNCVVPYKIYL